MLSAKFCFLNFLTWGQEFLRKDIEGVNQRSDFNQIDQVSYKIVKFTNVPNVRKSEMCHQAVHTSG